MTSDSKQGWLRAAAVWTVVVLTLSGSTVAPVATATAPVPADERITNGIASTTATANTTSVTVSGTVTYPNGSAAENVTLRWLTEDGGDGDLQQVVTDANGSFTATLEANRSYETKLWQADLSDVNASTPTNVVYPQDGVADFTSLGWLNTTTTDVTRNYSFPVGHVLNVTVENESGSPIENASVGLRDGEGEVAVSFYSYLHADGVPTDAQGRMKHPPNPGTGIEVNGTTSVSAQPPTNSSYEGNYSQVTVTSDRNLTRTLSRTVAVSGTVRYPNGTTAENVTLRFLSDDGGNYDGSQVVTDANGSYTATLETNRSYEAKLWQADLSDVNASTPTNVVYPQDGVADFTSLGWVNTTTDPDVTRNYSFPVGHVLNVTVRNESGAPIENASVGLTDTEDGSRTSVYSYLHADGLPTDVQGRMYHPPNPGVGLEVNGTTDVAVRPPENSSYDGNYTEVFVGSDRNLTRTLTSSTTSTATVSGTVRNPDGTPAANVTVQWDGVNGTSNAERTVTDSNGDFSVQFDAAGDYRVTYWQGEVYAENVTFPRDGVADFGNLGLDSVADGTTTNYTLPVGHPLNVTVENESGAPVDEAEVVLSDHHPETDGRAYFYGYREGGVPTDSQGRMKHPENPLPGVEVNGSVGAFVDEPTGTDYDQNYTEFDVQGPRDETMVLYETTTVSGTVRNPNGTAAENVTLRWFTEQNGGDFAEVVTGANGNYSVEIRENHDYEVEMWQANLDDADPDSPTNVVYPKDGVADFAALGWHNTTATVETRNFTLPVGHTLNVTVQNASGAPVENASVQLVDRENGIWASFYSYLHEDGVPTDAQGRMAHPPNPGVGLELNGTIRVDARPPENTNLTSNGTEVSLTGDRDVTLTLREPTSVEGRWVGPDGEPVADATIYVADWSAGVIESTTTDAEGRFETSVPEGSYSVYVNEETTGNGIADAWLAESFEVKGDTSVGTLTMPRGYETSVNVTDGDGNPVDSYLDLRGGNDGWVFGLKYGQRLDRPSNYDTRTVDLANGSHSTTVYDSWTHDVLGTGYVTVDGSDRTATVSVNRFNGTEVSGAFGTTVVRDLQSPVDDRSVQQMLNESINVRLFVLNATNDTELHVTETLPSAYGLNVTSVVAEGPGDIENVTFADGTLSFDVRGDVSAVRYQAVLSDSAPESVRFTGEFGNTPTVGETALPAATNVSVFAPANGSQVGTANPTIEFVTRHPDASNATDLEYRVDGGTWKNLDGTPAIGSAQLAGLDDGQHTVTVRLVNENGTVVTDTTTFTVDTTA